MEDVKIYTKNERLNEAYEVLNEKITYLSQQYKLTYFEVLGMLEVLKAELLDEMKEEEVQE